MLTERIIGAAIEVHRHLGPGLLESIYEECLCYELGEAGLRFQRQVHLPINYKGIKLESAYKVDLVIEDLVVVEIKATEGTAPVHCAQLLTYLRASGKQVGLLINFNVPVLKNGLKRIVNRYQWPDLPAAEEPIPPNLNSSQRLGVSASEEDPVSAQSLKKPAEPIPPNLNSSQRLGVSASEEDPVSAQSLKKPAEPIPPNLNSSQRLGVSASKEGPISAQSLKTSPSRKGPLSTEVAPLREAS